MNFNLGVYPDIKNKNFYKKISTKKEFYDYRFRNDKELNKEIYCLENQQLFLRNFINPLTDYNSILIFHSVGVGKTLASIGIAENFKNFNKLILIKNKILQQNFKKELQSDCIINKENLNFSFITYGSLINRVLGRKIDNFKNKKIIKNGLDNIDNTLIIVDEAHNLTNNEGYIALRKLLDNSKNVKVILLTATPVYDNIKEIFELSNLLNDNKNQLPTRQNLLKENLIEYPITKVSNKLLKNNIPYLTEKGSKILNKTLRGKVSYLIQDTKNFPRKIYRGSKIDENSGVSFYQCYMSDFQENVYNSTFLSNSIEKTSKENKEDRENVLFKTSSDASTIVYPDGSIGKEGFIKNILENKTRDFLKKKNIYKYSCKLYNILNFIEKSKGSCFIYSNYVNYGGVELIKYLLIENGYSFYGSRNLLKKFVVIEEKTTPKQRKKILQIFNSPENKEGKLIKILIGSFIISEGITFKNVRQVHILEPYWNFSRIDQIIGRTVRFKSHSMLQNKDRKVDIFLHTSMSKKAYSIDFLKYELSINKDKSIKQVENLMKNLAVDCFLNKKRNFVKSIDYSRDCKYSKCEYKCPFEKEKVKQDISTYYLPNHSKEQYNFIENKIKYLFSKSFIYKLKDIVDAIKNLDKNIPEENIYYTLNDLIDNNTQLNDKFNRKSKIIYIGKYYITSPIVNKDIEPFIYKFYKKKFTKNVIEINNKQDKIKVEKIYKKVVSKPGIYATYTDKLGKVDNIFRILDFREKNAENYGKVCNYYSKQELLEFLEYLKVITELDDIDIKNLSKKDLCFLIEYAVIEKKLII